MGAAGSMGMVVAANATLTRYWVKISSITKHSTLCYDTEGKHLGIFNQLQLWGTSKLLLY